MQTYMMIQNGWDGWEIIDMNKVIKVLPKLVCGCACCFYPQLDRIDIPIRKIREIDYIIIRIIRAYQMITNYISPK